MKRLGSKRENSLNYKCTIRLLDDSEVIECEFQSYEKGKYLLDTVFEKLNIIEIDYFGLRFVDHHKQRHWLDPSKNILRQIKNMNPILLCFRVKFYPADPMRLHEEITRYLLFLQLRRDLLHGRLYCTQSDAATLGAYIIQADLGDYNSEEHTELYVNEYRILLKQTLKNEEKITDIHKTLAGLSPSAAELYFLKKASTLDTYGVDPFSVKDHRSCQLYLGLNHTGILTFQGSRRTHHFKWSEVQKLNYEGKMFIIHLIFYEDARTKRKHTVGFKCSSATACRHLWRAAVEQRLFYTLNSNKQGVIVTGGSFFSRGSRFRYHGRCEREVVEESTTILREPPTVKRVSMKSVGKSNSLPSTPADSDNYDTVVSRVHRPLPYIDRSASLDEEVLCGMDGHSSPDEPRKNTGFVGPGSAYCSESTLPPISLLEPLLEANEGKSRSSSVVDSSLLENEKADTMGYYVRGGRFMGNSAKYDIPKKNRHHPFGHNVGYQLDDELDPQYRRSRYSLQNPEDMNLGDTSSTDTLNPTTEANNASSKRAKFSKLNKRNVQMRSLPLHEKDNDFYYESYRANMPTNSSSLTQRRQNIFYKYFTRNPLLSVIRFAKIFVIVFILIVLTLCVLLVVVFESENYFENAKSSSEMILFRIQYYDPIRGYLARNLYA